MQLSRVVPKTRLFFLSWMSPVRSRLHSIPVARSNKSDPLLSTDTDPEPLRGSPRFEPPDQRGAPAKTYF